MKPFAHFLWVVLLAVALPAHAQEQIDKLMNQTSAMRERIKFTTVVERNLRTGRVVRVTKSLQNVAAARYAEFERAFQQAERSKNLTQRIENAEDGEHTLMLIFKTSGRRSVYTLIDNRRSSNTFNVFSILNIE